MKVLLAVEDEKFGDAIVQFAIYHGWPPATEFQVVHIIPSILDYTYLAAVPDIVKDLREESRKMGSALVRKIGLKLREVFHSTRIEEVVAEGHPAEEILSLARNWKADLILVGSHGRRGISRLMMGSVSTAVVSHAPCSVLVIRLTPSAAGSEEHQTSREELSAAT